jgi:BirA family biotin operon repressor/biotin-[acetyl-CoA-carboxylase] ligase
MDSGLNETTDGKARPLRPGFAACAAKALAPASAHRRGIRKGLPERHAKIRAMSRRFHILTALSDGRFHSGEALGEALGISRTAVWKHLKALGEWGLDVHAVPGKGYRLAAPLELLRREPILAALDRDSRPLLAGLELHPHLASTNSHLSARAAAGLASGHACLTEYQTAGRGRRGRGWVSPFAANIYLSVLWRFTLSPAALGGLGLAVGVAVARTLQQAGLHDIGLKWPNDVMWRGGKLAGTLLEMSGESSGPVAVVIGIGLNVRMPAPAGAVIDQPWVDLETALGRGVSRNAVAGRLLHHLLQALRQYQLAGLTPFLEEWRRHDLIAGKTVRLQLPHRILTGVAQGVDPSGALLLQDRGTITRHTAGDVSVRL